MRTSKEISWKILLIYFTCVIGLGMLVNFVLFPGPWFTPVSRATSGLVNATLQANLLGLILFCLFVFAWGRLKPTDVGLEWSKLPQALLVTGLVWVGVQVVALVIAWIGGGVTLDPLWRQRGGSVVLGLLIGQALGNALVEELVYRGLLLPQFFLKIKISNPMWRVVTAAAVMLALFILSHIPNRIFQGYNLGDMLLDAPILLLWGLLFTAVYLITDNLFLAVGVHALVNSPTQIVALDFPPQIILLALVILLLVLWRRLTKTKTLIAGRVSD